MERRRFSVSLFIRKNRTGSTGQAPIYMKITLLKKSATMNLNLSVNPSKWDSKGFVVGRSKEANDTNEYIVQCKARVFEIYRNTVASGINVTPQMIKDEYLGKTSERIEYTLIQVIRDHNDEMKSLIGVKYSLGTLKNYRTTMNHITEFIPLTYGNPDIALKDLEYSFITKFEKFLLTVKNCTNNGVMKQIQRLNKIMNRAIKMGWMATNPFKAFKVSYKRTERGFLTISEVNTLESAELPTRLSRVRDVFIFQVYTGLAYCDVKALSQTNIRKGVDGKDWIFLSRQKTQVTSMIPLLRKAQEVLDRYSADNKCLPVISNQKMNKGLQEIAKMVGVSKRLTTHLARHTFATTITLSNGVPIETVSKMLGHTKLSTTQIYSKIVEQKIADDMSKLRGLG